MTALDTIGKQIRTEQARKRMTHQRTYREIKGKNTDGTTNYLYVRTT